MYLSSITIQNFRCYDGSTRNRLSLGRSVNVLIGKNGSGKTTVISAIKKSLGFILSKDRRQSVAFIGDGVYVKNESFERFDAHRDVASYEMDGFSYPISLSCQGYVGGQSISWRYLKEGPNHFLSQMDFREALDIVLDRYHKTDEHIALPLLAYFSDTYPHENRPLDQFSRDVVNDSSGLIQRNVGYYKWQDSDNCSSFWHSLFFKAYQHINDYTRGLKALEARLKVGDNKNIQALETRLKFLQEREFEVNYIARKLIDFTGAIPELFNELEMQVAGLTVENFQFGNSKKDHLKVIFTNGEESLFETLPLGYRRILSMVFEIAYRNFILNKRVLLEDKTMEPEGVVIIDEVELHLHPALTQEIVERLHFAFPNIQFIVSTHSPLVLSNLSEEEGNKIIALSHDHEKVYHIRDLESMYGLDYNTTIREVMNTPARPHKLGILKQLYVTYGLEDDVEGMAEIKKRIERLIKDSTRLEQIISILDQDIEENR